MKRNDYEMTNDFYEYLGGPGGPMPAVKGMPRRLFKGGGSNHDALRIEEERKREAQKAIAAINRIFDSANRNALYQQQRNNVYDLNADEVERQAAEAERQNRFGLARNGLIGGSAQIDSNAELNRRTNRGLAKAGGIADDAKASLMKADENTRSNLVSMATAGTDATTAAQLANSGLKQNAVAAQSNASAATVGNLFNDLTNAYLYNSLSKYAQNAYSFNPYYTAAASAQASKGDTHNTYQGS
jgi:hypothetical protein